MHQKQTKTPWTSFKADEPVGQVIDKEDAPNWFRYFQSEWYKYESAAAIGVIAFYQLLLNDSHLFRETNHEVLGEIVQQFKFVLQFKIDFR